MSTVLITELVVGNTTAASDINDTNVQWNNATAAGSIAASNFREEGIDRRVIAQHAVYSTARGTNSFLSEDSGTAASLGNPTPFLFGVDTYIGPIDGPAANTVVGYSVSGFDTAVGNTLTTYLEWSPDAAVWSALVETVRVKTTRVAANPNGSLSAKTVWPTPYSANYFRLMVVGTNAATFENGTLYAYVLLE